MRVGLVIYGTLATVSGGYLYDRRLVDHLQRHGATVMLLTRPWRHYAAHLADNARRGWLRQLRDAPVDVLVQDELNHPSLAWLNGRLRRSLRTPIVTIVHHLRSSERHPRALLMLYRHVERRYLSTVDGLIYNSASSRAAVTALLPAAGQRPGVIAPPAGDRLQPDFAAATVAARAGSGPLRVLFVGTLQPRKGVHTLLAALAACGDRPIEARIIGSPTADPRYAAALRHDAARRNLRNVTWLGALPDDALTAEYAAAHLLVVPSQFEGFGIVYLEAMGFGLPAIGSTGGGAGEIISDGVNGYLIAPEDAPALAQRLCRLADDRALLAALGIAALARYRAQPTWEMSMARAHTFLQQMVAGVYAAA